MPVSSWPELSLSLSPRLDLQLFRRSDAEVSARLTPCLPQSRLLHGSIFELSNTLLILFSDLLLRSLSQKFADKFHDRRTNLQLHLPAVVSPAVHSLFPPHDRVPSSKPTANVKENSSLILP
jgi:hypothetical protein